MSKSNQPNHKRDYYQLERQRKALRFRLYQMIDELEGRPVNRRTYQPFPIGILEKTIEKSLQSLESIVTSLVIAVEKRIPKPWEKRK